MLRAFTVAAFACLVLAGCGSDDQTIDQAVTGEVVIERGNAGEPDSLDPHFTTTDTQSTIVGEMLIGLTTEAADGSPIPGAAETWEVSEDGLTWTFHLRDHNWSDGTPVTADDFVYAWQRILDPVTAAPYAAILYVFENAEAIASGELPKEMLAASAIDAHTLELRLENPAPYLPELLSHAATYPVPRHIVEQLGNAWVRTNYVANGPYLLQEWVPNDHITLVKNPGFYDANNVQIDRIVFHPITDQIAGLRRFRAGELDTLHGFPVDQIDWLRANMPDELKIGPFLASASVTINNARPPFDDVRIREALNLAYDRDSITQTIMRTGQDPAYSIIPPGVANYPGPLAFWFKELTYEERISRARELMRDAGYGPNNPLELTFSTGPTQDARRIAAAVQQMWNAIFVTTEIVQAEGRIHYARMREGDFDVGPHGWIADFNDAYNFLFLYLSNNEGLNYANYNNPAFDLLLKQANQEQDLEARGEILARAEQILLDDSVVIPTRYEITTNMVHTYVKNWIINVSETNRTRWLSIERVGDG